MNKYHIRYNTKHGESDLVWRIKKHLKTVNMNYFQHMYIGWKIGLELIISFFTIIVHSINPAWFEYSTSKRIEKLYKKIKKR